MALWSRHTTVGVGSPTVATQTFTGAFNQVTVVNRSTSAIYFTSLVSQGTAADGVPTLTGNNTYYLGACTAVDTPGPLSQKIVYDAVASGSPGTDYVTISIVCANTAAQYSVIAE